ncbi:MAG: diacylglycerol kinase family protein [Atopobiaceae bacterium]|jgi:diacylglycerol kinase|nr:diacylglycerol kinase family protein [Atopobiaceae bacterium]
MIPGQKENHPTFRRSFLFAMQGFRMALKTERNIKVMLLGLVFAVTMGIVLQIDLLSWAIILLCCGVVIAAELLNTAIETVVDLVSPEYHPLAGRAKDISAGAVWSLCVIVALVGIIVFARAILG